MTIRVKNIQYFDWEVPEELNASENMPHDIVQQLVDEHFDPDNLSVEQVSDDYYEFKEFL